MRVLLALALMASSAQAEVVVAARTIRAKEVITAADLRVKLSDSTVQGITVADLLGQEARVALYAGRPIRPSDVGPPAIVDRNALVTLVFANGPLSIMVEGRSLGRGAAGDVVKAMNLSSRTTITGLIRPDGKIEVK